MKLPSPSSVLVVAGVACFAVGIGWWVHPGAGLVSAGAALVALGWPT